jgi:hypothetical protein
MDFGITLPTPADSWKTVKRAEDAGFSIAWFYDTQVLSADIFVAMGAAAVKTDRIRLGTGVLIPSNRIVPVAAKRVQARIAEIMRAGALPPLASSVCKRPDAGSRMSREAHVRFCERAVVRFRRATRLVVFGERHLRHLLNSYQKILQRSSDAPIAAQGRANPTCCPDHRSHAGGASSGRAASPIFQRTQQRTDDARRVVSVSRRPRMTTLGWN